MYFPFLASVRYWEGHYLTSLFSPVVHTSFVFYTSLHLRLTNEIIECPKKLSPAVPHSPLNQFVSHCTTRRPDLAPFSVSSRALGTRRVGLRIVENTAIKDT